MTGVLSSWVTLATNSDFTLDACCVSCSICSIFLFRNSFSSISFIMHTRIPDSSFSTTLASTGKQVRFLRYAIRFCIPPLKTASAPPVSPADLKTPGKMLLICPPQISSPYPSFVLAAALAQVITPFWSNRRIISSASSAGNAWQLFHSIIFHPRTKRKTAKHLVLVSLTSIPLIQVLQIV